MTIPDIDETTIRAIAAQCAGQCGPDGPMQLICWADIILEWIDPTNADTSQAKALIEKLSKLEKKP